MSQKKEPKKPEASPELSPELSIETSPELSPELSIETNPETKTDTEDREKLYSCLVECFGEGRQWRPGEIRSTIRTLSSTLWEEIKEG